MFERIKQMALRAISGGRQRRIEMAETFFAELVAAHDPDLWEAVVKPKRLDIFVWWMMHVVQPEPKPTERYIADDTMTPGRRRAISVFRRPQSVPSATMGLGILDELFVMVGHERRKLGDATGLEVRSASRRDYFSALWHEKLVVNVPDDMRVRDYYKSDDSARDAIYKAQAEARQDLSTHHPKQPETA